MIENRELTMDDYLSMLRRRMKVIVIPALLLPLIGFLVSYAFAPKYTAQATVAIEDQKVPEGYVKSVVTEDAAGRVVSLWRQVSTTTRLRPMIEQLGLAKGKNLDDVAEEIQQNFVVKEAVSDITAQKRKMGKGSDFTAFSVSFTADNPHDAQTVCNALTSMMIAENLKSRAQTAASTTDFLSRQVDESKKNLEELDNKLATFKKQYMGQLPGDEENNMRILMGLNSQLDANTQTLNRAQQDKSYTESILAQQLAAWKSSQTSTNPTTLEQQLAAKQTELITLQARYTDDYPDVAKAKNDVAELKRRLAAMNSAAAQPTDTVEKSALGEPPEIRQLRLQIHQYDEAISQATRDQKRLQAQIGTYQGRVSLSPAVEEQYKGLTRDYETAQKTYNELLLKRSQSQMATEMERAQQGEQMQLTNPAGLPDKPSFPNRLLFAGGGLGAGLGIGLGLALWLEMRDKSIRTEEDVLAVLGLPLLVSVPWIGADAGDRGSDGRLHARSKPPADEAKETVEV
jgi:polysaccharide chain length determinant protein (PEP-CTERM system associated)